MTTERTRIEDKPFNAENLRKKLRKLSREILDMTDRMEGHPRHSKTRAHLLRALDDVDAAFDKVEGVKS